MKFLILFAMVALGSAVVVQQQQQQNQCGLLLNKQQLQQKTQFFPWIVSIAIRDTAKLMLRDYFIMVDLTPVNERSQIPSFEEMKKNVGTLRHTQQGAFMCSGVLISPNFVLTSAKCVYNISATDLIVNFGLTDLKMVKQGQNELFVKNVIVRNDFNIENVDNNLALLQLSKPIEHMSNMVNTICLPTEESQKLLGTTTTKDILAGFGFYEPVKQTQQHMMSSGSQEQQQLPNQSMRHSFIRLVNVQQGKCEAGGKNTLCGVAFDRNSDVCLGDDGSPVFHELNNKFFLNGVVSFFNSQQQQQSSSIEQQSGEQEQQPEQCLPAETKITITNIVPYLTWINSFIQQQGTQGLHQQQQLGGQQQTQKHITTITKTKGL